MNQIMRLRRLATRDHHITDRNNGERHESAFVTLVRKYGVLWEAELLPRSYGGDSTLGKFAPKAGAELVDSLPVIARAVLRGKVTPGKALLPPREVAKEDRRQIQRIYDVVESRPEQRVLNLYISGYDEDLAGAETGNASAQAGAGDGGQTAAEAGQPGMSPEESPTR
jgi:succinate dehydrogenase / fumarate reductase, iron-sulfur subunit